ncbi:Glyoxalase-like domain protein [Posidoniimonas corsicana]|uniref:Glyoxalase-like domain protein n=1 Tax=Posidoniimonas corsicana TaxID=1938618 RepID=A0A5C5UUJ7_9BACT|nr:VOC family protein [Posidoniimonas corsicana]TWT29210.1 Glyoxalase-like domain protein [Posidoniimonas corsicana]
MPTPTGCQFVPYLSIRDAGPAVAFYARVFGVEPSLRLDMPDGRVMHCEFRVGGGRFFVSEELPEHGGQASPAALGGTTVAVHLYVNDCDAVVRAMADAGATVLADQFWGERFARVRDPFGHEWGVATQLQEMTPAEIESSAAALFAKMAE